MTKFNFPKAIEEATPEQVLRIAKALNITKAGPGTPKEHMNNLFLIWREQQRSIDDFRALLAEPPEPLPDSTKNQ